MVMQQDMGGQAEFIAQGRQHMAQNQMEGIWATVGKSLEDPEQLGWDGC